MKYELDSGFNSQLKLACNVIGKDERFDLVFFDCQSGKDIKISAGDNNVGIKIDVPNTFNGSKKSKQFCLSGSKLKKILKLKLDLLQVSKDGKHVTFTSEKSKIKFGVQAESLAYNHMPIPEEKDIIAKITMPFDRMSTLKDRAIQFCSSEKNRYNLSCISLHMDNEGTLHVCASDGKRFAWQQFKDCDYLKGESFCEDNVLIHPRVFQLVTQMEKSESCSIALYKDGILFESGNVSIFSRASEGKFPPTSFVKTNFPNLFKLEYKKANVLFDKAMLLCSENTQLLCSLDKEFLVETGEKLEKDDQVSFKSSTDIEKVSGDNMAVKLNAKFLTQGVKAIGEDFLFGIESPTKMVGLFDKEDFTFVYALMPIKDAH